MDTQAVAGVDSVIYTTSDIGMANTLRDTSRTGMEVREFNGVYQIDCTTPEQIASFFFLAGADIKASYEAGQTKEMGHGRVVFDMSGTNAGAAVIQYNYPVCYTPNVGRVLGDNWTLLANTPENRQLFADAWLASDGQIDLDMKGLTNNGDGSPVYTTPDTWYGVFRIDGKEYFTINSIPQKDRGDNFNDVGGDLEFVTVEHEGEGTWSAFCYKAVSTTLNVPIVLVSGDEMEDYLCADMTLIILRAMGRIS